MRQERLHLSDKAGIRIPQADDMKRASANHGHKLSRRLARKRRSRRDEQVTGAQYREHRRRGGICRDHAAPGIARSQQAQAQVAPGNRMGNEVPAVLHQQIIAEDRPVQIAAGEQPAPFSHRVERRRLSFGIGVFRSLL